MIVKPDIGVGAEDTWKLENEKDLKAFFANKPQVPYVMEEFVYGNIYSYDAICGKGACHQCGKSNVNLITKCGELGIIQ